MEMESELENSNKRVQQFVLIKNLRSNEFSTRELVFFCVCIHGDCYAKNISNLLKSGWTHKKFVFALVYTTTLYVHNLLESALKMFLKVQTKISRKGEKVPHLASLFLVLSLLCLTIHIKILNLSRSLSLHMQDHSFCWVEGSKLYNLLQALLTKKEPNLSLGQILLSFDALLLGERITTM